ncbi:MAG: hypothetical protein JKY65_27585 [Planctomycetes bacterium]|nr:hypothetical protein [Planctomycetota bacterium]
MGIDEANQPPERGGFRYPLYRRNDRTLPPEWCGNGYVWDIDNTYLITEYEGIRDLIRIRFEEAIDKKPVPGAVSLLTGIRRHATEEQRPPIHFVSASPHAMRETLERRMLLDGVVHDGIAFRDFSKLRYLRDIFGYKIAALLTLRLEQPRGLRECLFGDDREHDPWVYSIYTRICAGTLRGKPLYRALRDHGLRRSSSRYGVALAADLPEHDPVDWVFIRRLRVKERDAAPTEGAGAEVDTESDDFESEDTVPERRVEDLDPRVLFVDDYGQAAAVLHAASRLHERDLRAVLEAVLEAGQGQAPGALLEQSEVVSRLPDGAAATTLELLEKIRAEESAREETAAQEGT